MQADGVARPQQLRAIEAFINALQSAAKEFSLMACTIGYEFNSYDGGIL